jgi:sec-independent protein translocase protein TatC
MSLRNLFKFRELPESETSKPFLEHLEDLRWTIVKMAITLLIAMVICFAFRSSLVQVMQRPLQEIDPKIGALRAMGVTDSLTISFRLAFYAGIVLSFPLLLYFLAEFVLPALTAMEKRSSAGDLRQLQFFSPGCWPVIAGLCRRRFFSFLRTRNRSADA